MMLLLTLLFASLERSEFLNSTVDGLPAISTVGFDSSYYPSLIGTSLTLSSSVTSDEWNWQINLTEVAVPNSFDRSSITNYSQGYRAARSAWTLTFGGEDVHTYLNRTKLNAYFVIYGGQVTKLYGSNNTCASFLGSDCAQAARSAVAAGRPSLPGSLFRLNACNGTIGAIGQTQFNLGFPTNINRTGPIVDKVSGAYAGSNTVVFRNATSDFNLLGVSFSQGNSTGSVPQPLLLCQSVNITAIKTGSVGRIGSSIWTVVLALVVVLTLM